MAGFHSVEVLNIESTMLPRFSVAKASQGVPMDRRSRRVMQYVG
jgi:hypothetical protein